MYLLFSKRLVSPVLMLLFITVYCIGVYGISLSEFSLIVWTDMFWTLAALIATVQCFRTSSVKYGKVKLAWRFIGFGCLSWLLGMLIWIYFELILRQDVPFVNLSDLAFLLFAPLVLYGLILYRNTSTTSHVTLKQFSELSMILTAVVITLIIVLFKPINSFTGTNFELSVGIAYAVLYVGVFFYGLTIGSINSLGKRRSIRLLLTGLGIHAFTNTIYSFLLLGKTYRIGDYLDVFWIAGFGFVYLAAEYEFRKSKSDNQLEASADDLEVFSKVEAILPGIILFWLTLVFIYFYPSINEQVIELTMPGFVLLTVFLVLRGWAQHQIQKELYIKLDRAYDVLDEKVMQRTMELQVAMEKAESASRAKSIFLSNMSHELRTPLNAIMGFAQLMEIDNNSLDENQRDSVQEILSASRHLLALINEILDMQKIAAGKVSLDMQAINLRQIIDESLQLVNYMADKKGIKIKISQCESDMQVYADYVKLKQVLVNLLSNAIKYNREDGQVNIVCGQVKNNQLAVSIHDTGVGINESDFEKIFNPFERVTESTAEGSGIGLAVTRELVLAMDGHITLDSESGKGSCFSIFLKCNTNQAN